MPDNTLAKFAQTKNQILTNIIICQDNIIGYNKKFHYSVQLPLIGKHVQKVGTGIENHLNYNHLLWFWNLCQLLTNQTYTMTSLLSNLITLIIFVSTIQHTASLDIFSWILIHLTR